MSGILLLVVVGLVFGSGLFLAWALLSVASQSIDQYRTSFTEAASSNMSDMFLFVDPQRLFYLNLAALLVIPLLVLMLTFDPIAAAIAFFLILVLPPFIYRRMKLQRFSEFERQLPDGLTMIAGGLRAGASLQIAIAALVREQPAPISQEFELFLRQQRVGSDFVTALSEMEARLPMEDFKLVASAFRISREVGGNLAETLETLSDMLRQKSMMEGKIVSLTAQGRLQAIVMSALPIVLALILNVLEPEAMSKIWTTPAGWITLGFIVVWESLGFFFIRKVVSIDV